MSSSRRNQLAWAFVILLTLLCGLMAILQYRWIDEIAQAERERLRNELTGKLDQLSRNFNETVWRSLFTISPPQGQVEHIGVIPSYTASFMRWQARGDRLFSRFAVAISGEGEPAFYPWNGVSQTLAEAPWPAEWSAIRDRIASGANLPDAPGLSQVLELPHFRPGPRFGNESRGETILLAELNLDFLRNTLFPQLLSSLAADGGSLEYNAEVYVAGDPSIVIFRSKPDPQTLPTSADATVPLLDLRRDGRSGPPRGPEGRFLAPGPPFNARSVSAAGVPAHTGRWILAAHHRAGSLEAIVGRGRLHNLILSGTLLLLIIATSAWLVSVSQERERLAELRMNFVTGVSHELRTPLTVIRTAAFNLRGRLAQRPDQVEKYGKLIAEESEKLTTLVERVLLFGSARSGQLVQWAEPVSALDVIQSALALSTVGLENPPHVELSVDPDLLPLLVDPGSVRMALRNILENAVKYALRDHNWIGVSAAPGRHLDSPGNWIEIRIADHGPGIPEEERAHIFDPFVRGRQALRDQLHGTGLGLNLAKTAVEANGGSIEISSPAHGGTEFIVRLPAQDLRSEKELSA